MKYIKHISSFLNEEIENDIKSIPQLAVVVNKSFFNELKQHIFYWFNYDFLKDTYSIISLNNSKSDVVVWFKDDKYTYKVSYSFIDEFSEIEKVTSVKMTISVYGLDGTSLLKTKTDEQTIKYLNAKSFKNLIGQVVTRIIEVPKSQNAIDNFNAKELRRLGDNIY